MSEKDDNETKPYSGVWSYRHWLKVLPAGIVLGVLAYLKATGRI